MQTTCSKCRKPDTYCESIGEFEGRPIYYCVECKSKNEEIREEVLVEVKEREEKRALDVLANAKKIDESLAIQTDIFNAQTVSIEELRKAIEADPTITEKHFTLAKFLSERYENLQELIIGARSSIVEAETRKRAILTHYIELSKKLRQEEREKLRFQDLKYQPAPVKTVSPRKVSTKKADKEEAVRISKESGVPLQILLLLALTKNLSYKDAAIEFKKVENSVKNTKS